MEHRETIRLYDVPQKSGHACFSPNVWKTRLVLNYKTLPYTTHWIELPEIAPHFNPLLPDREDYTLPAIQLPKSTSEKALAASGKEHGQIVMDSAHIADVLESLYPERGLHLQTRKHASATEIIMRLGRPVLVALISSIKSKMVTERSATYWEHKIGSAAGLTAEQIGSLFTYEEALQISRPIVAELEALFEKKGAAEGPYMLGLEPCYGDFVVVAFMEWIKRVDENRYDGFFGHSVTLVSLHKACRTWIERDG